VLFSLLLLLEALLFKTFLFLFCFLLLLVSALRLAFGLESKQVNNEMNWITIIIIIIIITIIIIQTAMFLHFLFCFSSLLLFTF
jgi:hypothetical protein